MIAARDDPSGLVGIGWNGVHRTLMAELAGPRSAGMAVGMSLAVSSLGVTLGPPVFGYVVERAGAGDEPFGAEPFPDLAIAPAALWA